MPDKHYVTIKAAIMKEGKILLQKEYSKSQNGYVWDLPGGRIDIGETIEAGLHRELYEEIGIKPKSISDVPVQVWATKGGEDGVVALLFAVELESEDFRYNNGVTDEVEEARYLSLDEVQASPDHVHKPFILEYLEQYGQV